MEGSVRTDSLLIALGSLCYRPVRVQAGPVEVADDKVRRGAGQLDVLVEHGPRDVRGRRVRPRDNLAHARLGARDLTARVLARVRVQGPAAGPPHGDGGQLCAAVMWNTEQGVEFLNFYVFTSRNQTTKLQLLDSQDKSYITRFRMVKK